VVFPTYTYVTINPADSHNPLHQVFAGREINMDKFFDNVAQNNESLLRSQTIAENPVAGAKGFEHLIKGFTDILLGYGQPDKTGVFGKVDSYYGVVEAQGRGSLHFHSFVWLEDGLSPNEVKEKALNDPEWKKQLFAWVDDIICQSFPEPSDPYKPPVEKDLKSKLVLCRPLNPNDPGFDNKWKQDLCDVLECTGQVHTHSTTCWKHLPQMMQSLKDDDADCHFNLPRETVTETYIDEDGHLHIQCLNGNINGYNDICVSCLRCNMDIKYVGSGTAAMAMVEYVTNYIAKMSLDSTTVFAALCGAIKSVNDNPPINPLTEEIDPAEKSRLVLLKTCNSMIGKRELSGQQVVSFLCNIPNHFTNHQFDKLFWTSILNFACPNLFEAYNLTADSDGTSDESDPDPIIQEASPILITNATEQGMVMLDSICKGESVLPELPQQVTYVQDVLYRPVELQHLSLWDLFSFYASVRLPKEKKKTKLDSMNVTNENASEQPSDPVNNGKVFQFLPDHPKCSMHCFKLRAVPITPVLLGRGVPRRDKENTKDAHAIQAMVFRPSFIIKVEWVVLV